MITSFCIYSKTKVLLYIAKLFFIMVYIILIVLYLNYAIMNLKSRDRVNQFIQQYISYFLKKITIYQIKQRLQQKLYYDGLTTLLQFLFVCDQIFIFRCILIIDLPWINLVISILNFIVIHTQNIMNVNIIYKIYRECLRTRILIILNIFLVYLIIPVFGKLFEFLSQQYAKILSCVVNMLLFKKLKEYFGRNSSACRLQQERNIQENQYEKYRIEVKDIPQFQCQQAVISYM